MHVYPLKAQPKQFLNWGDRCTDVRIEVLSSDVYRCCADDIHANLSSQMFNEHCSWLIYAQTDSNVLDLQKQMRMFILSDE